LFRQLNALNDSLFALIAARRRGQTPPANENVLDDLLAATHEDGTPLDDQEVRDAMITILIAGHDTTALALAWALAEIVPRPAVVERLTAELRRVTGRGPPQAEQLPATLLSQVRLARPAGALSRARRYGLVLGPDDGARVVVQGTTR